MEGKFGKTSENSQIFITIIVALLTSQGTILTKQTSTYNKNMFLQRRTLTRTFKARCKIGTKKGDLESWDPGSRKQDIPQDLKIVVRSGG